MSRKQKVVFNWSGGKDSALALYKLLQQKEYDVVNLLTSVSQPYQRISMHGVRVDLLDMQAERIGIPLIKMQIPEMPSMGVYENIMSQTLAELKNKGVTVSAFGDIFLEDLRKYREEKLASVDMKSVFPIWKSDSREVIREFLDLGFKTIVSCVNEKYLDKGFAGRIINEDFLNELPPDVDPCGENGEFHTFVFEGPLFKDSIPLKKGEIVYRKYSRPRTSVASDQDAKQDPYEYGFWYCDLIPD